MEKYKKHYNITILLQILEWGGDIGKQGMVLFTGNTLGQVYNHL